MSMKDYTSLLLPTHLLFDFDFDFDRLSLHCVSEDVFAASAREVSNPANNVSKLSSRCNSLIDSLKSLCTSIGTSPRKSSKSRRGSSLSMNSSLDASSSIDEIVDQEHASPISMHLRKPPKGILRTASVDPVVLPKHARTRRLLFNEIVTVGETYSAIDYERGCEENHMALTPALAHFIRVELNTFKKYEMIVDPSSVHNTHYY